MKREVWGGAKIRRGVRRSPLIGREKVPSRASRGPTGAGPRVALPGAYPRPHPTKRSRACVGSTPRLADAKFVWERRNPLRTKVIAAGPPLRFHGNSEWSLGILRSGPKSALPEGLRDELFDPPLCCSNAQARPVRPGKTNKVGHTRSAIGSPNILCFCLFCSRVAKN
jgi:hypothetical protein